MPVSDDFEQRFQPYSSHSEARSPANGWSWSFFPGLDLIGDHGAERFRQVGDPVRAADPGAVLVSEWFVNEFGGRLLKCHRKADGVAVTAYNVEHFPKSANAYDSLGEAYLVSGEREQALAAFRQAVAIDPTFSNSLARIKALAPDAESDPP